ncbi:MAG: PfaB family protein [Anaerolineales bacterium]
MSTEKIAIVGMEVELGACRDLDTFSRHLYEGTGCAPTGTPNRGDASARALSGALADARVTPGAPVPVLTPEEGLFAVLEDARRRLSTGEAEEIAVVAGDEQDAAALVVRTLRRAQARRDRIYALLEGQSTLHCQSPPAPETIEDLCRRTMEESGVLPREVGYAEVCATGRGGPEDILEGLSRAYATSGAELTCALGSSPRFEGATPLRQMMALLKSALCLHQRFLPAHPHRSTFGTAIPPSPFYVDEASRPWFVAGADGRLASLLSVDEEGRCTHLLLSDYPQPRRDSRQLQNAACYLLPLGGEEEALLAALRRLRRRVDESATETELQTVARRCFETYRRQSAGGYTLVLVGQTREALLRDIDFALEGVPQSIRRQQAWSTPRGSYFTPRPLAEEGEVAFVYPGAFNAYPNLGRDLFRLFPRLHERFARIIPDLGEALAERMLYPRSVAPLSRGDWRAHEGALVKQPALLIEAGTSFAILFTALLRDHFGVRPASAFGYSLGEASMLWAAEIWQDVDAGSRAWRNSPLFESRLSGRKEAVRERWGVPPRAPDDTLWQTYLLKAPVEEIRAALREEPRVTLSMINTPREGVIGGDPAGCRRVIEALDCHALPVPYDAVIHADVMRSELPELVELYTHPIAHRPACTFYSAACAAPLQIGSRSLARALAEMTCRQIDFPRLVEQAYASGARLFVELGPQRTCTRWIDEILAGKPHAAMAINKKGTPDVVSIFGVLAQLLSHGVEVDISDLYATGEAPNAIPAIEAVYDERVHVPVLAGAGQEEPADGPLPDAGARSHGAFLEARHTSLQETGASIRTQIDAYAQLLQSPQPSPRSSRRSLPLFDSADLEAFATGSPARCFGPAYAAFEGRRLPRIPNGGLMLISRVLDVEGTPGEIRAGSTLVSEYDVPEDAWFYRQNGSPTTPYAVYMEMALQPCGFLSAYLGSALSHAASDLYFRNLDGAGRLRATPDLRGRTVTDRVRLLSTTTVKGTILQRFAFSLACEGETFYEGEAAFGYFERRALLNQQGLDGGKASPPWCQEASLRHQQINFLDLQATETRRSYYTTSPTRPHYRLARDRLDFLDSVRIVEGGGRYGRGYVHAAIQIDPQDWFFACHFYQDPVMPGSLGLEAMLQALQVYALHEDLGGHLRSPRFSAAPELTTVWKYRGQVRPEDGSLELEVHLRDRDVRPDRVTLVGEASLWKGERRIYEVTDIGLRLQEAAGTKGVA